VLFRHNGAALSVIHAVLEALPKAQSIAYFDSTFHRSIPPHIAAYAIDQDVAKKRGIKKYGFHGLSCTLYFLLETSRSRY
jgi:acetate kinase